ncbi:MAG: beta-N-acetylhexosaminidase [Micromonosporaceae bacterium]
MTADPTEPTNRAEPIDRAEPTNPMGGLVPVPMRVEPARGVRFVLTDQTTIQADPGGLGVSQWLAELLRPSTGYPLPVRVGTTEAGADLRLSLTGDAAFGSEGYELTVTREELTLRAGTPAGLFRAAQTLRQLFAPEIERRSPQSGPWSVPGGRIVDRPRYAYRGVMLDVARHFFPVDVVKRLIDLAALHKVNHLHLHLTDDQGWRIAIDSWPRLASYGGGTEVGDGPGGFYTKAEYRDLVAYAAARFVTVVPEVDLPGHTNAALASYPELTGDGLAPERYTGIDVGFSSLCAEKEITYRFLDDVFGELAELTPGPYLHLGGDEAKTTGAAEYAAMVERAQQIVARHGKTAVGWQEIAAAQLAPDTVVQLWDVGQGVARLATAAGHGTRVILSPADRAYLDMKYDERSRLGLTWAGYVSVADAYAWDPATYLPGVPEAAILGLESPLWTETARGVADLDYLAFPRLAVIAELGWSPARSRDWAQFRQRLAAQGSRWAALGVGFYRSPDVPWPDAATP